MKSYTDEQYADLSIEASKRGQYLYIIRKGWCDTLEIAPYHYYICHHGNITDGTINPEFKKENKALAKEILHKKEMTPFDFLNKIYKLGVSQYEVEHYLEVENVPFRDFLNTNSKISCKDVLKWVPLDICDLHLTKGKIEKIFET